MDQRSEGQIIGYKPKLEYKKERVSDALFPSYAEPEKEDKRSELLKQLEEYSTDKIFDGIRFVTNMIDDVLGRITKVFNAQSYAKYSALDTLLSAYKNGDTEYINKFTEWHNGNPLGSTAPEIVKHLSETRERLKLIAETVKMLYYGDRTLTDEQIKQRNAELYNAVLQYETSGKRDSVNYYAMIEDAKLNQSIVSYVYSLGNSLLDMEACCNPPGETTFPEDCMAFTKTLFETSVEKINDRHSSFISNNSLRTQEKALYNYYAKRDEILKLRKIIAEVGEESGSSVMDMYDDAKGRLYESVKEVIKANMGHSHFMQSLVPLLEQEQECRRFCNRVL